MVADEKRISIYVSGAVNSLFGKRNDSESKSGRLSDVARRYMAIVRDEVKRLPFSENEWLAILDAGQNAIGFGSGDDEVGGNGMGPSTDGAFLWAEVQDFGLPGDDRFGIDRMALSRRIRGLSLAAHMALIETIRDFWISGHPVNQGIKERLTAFGVRFADGRSSGL